MFLNAGFSILSFLFVLFVLFAVCSWNNIILIIIHKFKTEN